MSDDNDARRSRFAGLFSGKKIGLILFGLVVAAGGFLLGYVGPSSAERERAADQEMALDGADAAGGRQAVDFEAARTRAAETGRSVWQKIGPHVMRLGISFAVGLVVGIFFRAFLVRAALVSALLLGGLAVLSYFQVLDFTTFRANYQGAADQVTTQAGAVKDWLLGWLPSTTGAILGFALGFLRK